MAQQLVLDADAVINLLPVLIDVRKRWKAGEDIAVGDEVRNVAAKLGVDDIEGFVQEQIQDHVAPVLDHAFNNDDAAEDAGAGNEVASMLAAMAVPVGKLVYAFARKDVTANDLFDGLDAIVNENADELGEVLRVALDIDIPPEAQGLMEKYAINAVSVYCFAAAYKIYAKPTRMSGLLTSSVSRSSASVPSPSPSLRRSVRKWKRWSTSTWLAALRCLPGRLSLWIGRSWSKTTMATLLRAPSSGTCWGIAPSTRALRSSTTSCCPTRRLCCNGLRNYL